MCVCVCVYVCVHNVSSKIMFFFKELGGQPDDLGVESNTKYMAKSTKLEGEILNTPPTLCMYIIVKHWTMYVSE